MSKEPAWQVADRAQRYRVRRAVKLADAKVANEQIARLKRAIYTAADRGQIPRCIAEWNELDSPVENLIDWLSGQETLFEVENTKRPAPKKSRAK